MQNIGDHPAGKHYLRVLSDAVRRGLSGLPIQAWAKCSMRTLCPSLDVGVWGATASSLFGVELCVILVELELSAKNLMSTVLAAIK